MKKTSMRTSSDLLFMLVTSIVITTTIACNNNLKSKQKKETAAATKASDILRGNFVEQKNLSFDSTAINGFIANRPEFEPIKNDLFEFYRTHNFNYVWFDKKDLIEPAHVLITTILDAEAIQSGATIPYKDELKQLAGYTSNTKDNLQSQAVPATEIMLTAQYIHYAKTMYGGSLNGKVDNWFLPRKKLSYTALLNKTLKGVDSDSLERESVIPQYIALKHALAQYQQAAEKGPDVIIPEPGKTIKPKQQSNILPLLAQRLYDLGDSRTLFTDSVYAGDLITAVNSFKLRHGFKPDSAITKEVVIAMNVPLKQRIESILINLERMRWIPIEAAQSKELILVNIPEYRLHYFENGDDIWDCNVVVGKAMTQTVVFSGDMKYIVFSPYWNVPPSIINKEIKPGMKRNKNYLASHNMEWNNGMVRQKPGPGNSLGLVKFLFPNSNNIYLHDTPSKSLFGKDDRAFSHGCVRVAAPRELAIRILKNDTLWTPEKIDAAMHKGQEKTVALKETIPVYIGYFTAFVDKNGLLNFRKDIYDRDSQIKEMLLNPDTAIKRTKAVL